MSAQHHGESSAPGGWWTPLTTRVAAAALVVGVVAYACLRAGNIETHLADLHRVDELRALPPYAGVSAARLVEITGLCALASVAAWARRATLKSDEALFSATPEPRWRALDAVLVALSVGALWSYLLDASLRSYAQEVAVIVVAVAGWSLVLLRGATGFRRVTDTDGHIQVTTQHREVLIARPRGALRFHLDVHDRMVCSDGDRVTTIGMRDLRSTASHAAAALLLRWEPDPERVAAAKRSDWFRASTSAPFKLFRFASWPFLAAFIGCHDLAPMMWPDAMPLLFTMAATVPGIALVIALIFVQARTAIWTTRHRWNIGTADMRPGVWIGVTSDQKPRGRRRLLVMGFAVAGLASGWAVMVFLDRQVSPACWAGLYLSMLMLRQLGIEAARELRSTLRGVTRVSIDGDRICSERPYALDVAWLPLADARLAFDGGTYTAHLDADRHVVGGLLSPEAEWANLVERLDRGRSGAYR